MDPVWINTGSIPRSQERSAMMREQLAGLVERGGATHHTSLGTTLAYLLRGLERSGRPYRLLAYPGRGYRLEVDPPG